MNQAMILKNKEVQTKITEQSHTIDSLKSQIGELSNSLRSRDSTLSKEAGARREAETQVEKLQARVKEVERVLDSSSKPSDSTDDSQLEALKVGDISHAYCTDRKLTVM